MNQFSVEATREWQFPRAYALQATALDDEFERVGGKHDMDKSEVIYY